jgi:hypothetical protein
MPAGAARDAKLSSPRRIAQAWPPAMLAKDRPKAVSF